MTQSINTGVNHTPARGAAMEAHTGAIPIGTEQAVKPRRHLLSQFGEGIRRRSKQRAERAYSLRMNGGDPRSIPGSEHAHLLKRPRGF
jgi:hypothetical protein